MDNAITNFKNYAVVSVLGKDVPSPNCIDNVTKEIMGMDSCMGDQQILIGQNLAWDPSE